MLIVIIYNKQIKLNFIDKLLIMTMRLHVFTYTLKFVKHLYKIILQKQKIYDC